ncbi:MAG: hypothetical protein GY773_34285 [Actinomycetia bacterium]|nr:hypothetical protein [Actinomycetes bacterium]
MRSTIDEPTSRGADRRASRGRDQGAVRASAGLPVGVRPGASATRQRQLPWVALGLLLLVMSMLGFALWSVQQAKRPPVLVAGAAIEAGTEIERSDLILVSVGADSGLELLQAGQEELVVGRVARGPIPVGTPLSLALVVSASEAVPEGLAVVGAALVPGEYPTSSLRAGDRVRLIKTTPANGLGDGGEVTEIGVATVWTVEPLLSSSQELFVSLLVPDHQSASVAEVVAQDQLRLVLIGADS